MKEKDRKKIDLNVVARGLQSSRSTANGKPSFTGGHFDDYWMILAEYWDFPKEIDHRTARELCSEAIFAAGARQEPITQATLNEELGAATKRFMRKAAKDYVLVSSLMLPWHTKFASRRVEGAYISFPSRLPKNFSRTFVSRISLGSKEANDQKLLRVRVRISARSASAAARHALHSLDFLRVDATVVCGRHQTPAFRRDHR